MSGLEDVIAERRRQINEEGWSADHDDQHDKGEMALAAASYAYTSTLVNSEIEAHKNALWGSPSGVFSVIRHLWRWEPRWFKPQNKRSDLVRAGALILAEIDRIDRQI